jgi:hypothetical protein
MNSSHPPPTGTRYKRPSLPPPDALRSRTTSLRESNDRLATSLGITIRRSAGTPRALAAELRASNDQREARALLSEEQESARQELVFACEALQENIALARFEGQATRFHESIDAFQNGVRQFLGSLVADSRRTRSEALRAMREAVAQMDQSRGLGQ